MNPSRKSKNEQGPNSAGQSGDTQQLPDTASADSESVENWSMKGMHLKPTQY